MTEFEQNLSEQILAVFAEYGVTAKKAGAGKAIRDLLTSHARPAAGVRGAIFAAVAGQIDKAYEKHGRELWGRHEFYGVLKEEVDELWDAIKADDPMEQVLKEALQVACVCVRYMETGDAYRGAHPQGLWSTPAAAQAERGEG